MTAALVSLLVPASSAVHAQPRPVTIADLPRLTAELTTATARAQAMQQALDRAAQLDAGLRVAYDRAEQSRAQAQFTLDVHARQVYLAAENTAVDDWTTRFAAPELQRLAHQGETAALRVDNDLVLAVTARSAQLAALQRQADAFRRRLMPQVQALLAEQDTARVLLAQAQALAVAAHAAQVQRQLEAQRALLDGISTATALVLTPGQQGRARAALDREGPVVALLEATGSGYPTGYRPSGVLLEGTASWYGPGFVGNPTASGAPYDPERLTCAHKTLPLGTVIRVSANGRAVSCLVDDRGPYVGDRILDMSRAGSRALGYSGLAHVVIEVLEPTG